LAVPVEAEPRQRVENLVDRLVGRAVAIGVLDPQQEGSPVVASEEPVEERRPGAPDVEVPGRARREAHAYGLARCHHRELILKEIHSTSQGSGHSGPLASIGPGLSGRRAGRGPGAGGRRPRALPEAWWQGS